MTWQIRRAGPGDAAAIQSVARAAWRDTYDGLLRPATIEAFLDAAYSVENLQQRIARHFFVVGELEGAVRAFAEAVEESDRIGLAAIYVSPEIRGRGGGTKLLDAIVAQYRDRPISADVLTGNRKGEAFYERRRFIPREELEGELFGEPVVERRWWRQAQDILDTDE